MTTTVLNTELSKVENKTPDNSKYITTQLFNKLTSEHSATRLKQANLVNKADFDNKVINFNRRITSNNYFRGLNVPEGDVECESFTFTSIDSLLVYKNKYYLQVYLDNCSDIYKKNI